MRTAYSSIVHKLADRKGSTMIFVLVLLTILVFTATSLMFAVYSSYTMSNIFSQSEGIVIDLNAVQSALTRELETRVGEILKNNIKIYNEENSDISDEMVELMYQVYGDKFNDELYLNKSEVKKILKDWIVCLQGDENVGKRENFGTTLYDIGFRLNVAIDHADNKILSRETDRAKDILRTDVPPIPHTNPALSSMGLNKFDIETVDVIKHLYGDAPNTPDYAWEWINYMCTTNPNPDNYMFYNWQDDRTKNVKVDYQVTAFSQIGYDKAGNISVLKKKIDYTYMLSAKGFNDNQIFAREVNLPTEFINERFKKIITTGGDITIRGQGGTVNLNGDVYAFGLMPGPSQQSDPNNKYEMGQTVIPVLYQNASGQWKRNYGGLIIGGETSDSTVAADGKTVNITGRVDTRAYVEVRSPNVNLNISQDVNADSIYIPLRRNEYDPNDKVDLNNIHINIDGNVNTYNDINVSAANSSVRIGGSYMGMGAGEGYRVNASSALILNNITSRIIINGQALISGLAFPNNITKTINGVTYPLRTGLSASAPDNHKLYTYDIHDTSIPGLGPSGGFNMHNYFTDDWTFVDMDGTISQARYLTSDDIIPNYASVDNLVYYFYDYLRMRERDGTKLALNYEPYNLGIILNKNQRHFAMGIVSAQAYSGDYNPNSPPPGKFYYLSGQFPVDPSVSTFDTMNAEPYSIDQFINVRDGVDGVSGIRKQVADELAYIKEYTDQDNRQAYLGNQNLNNTKSRANEIIDYDNILNSDDYDPIILNNFGTYYCYLTKSKNDLVFTNEMNNKRGLIYTSGKVIFKPTSDLTFDGVIIALGGVEINTNRNVTFNFDTNVIEEIINLDKNFPQIRSKVSQVRRFIAPGNEHTITLDTRDVYRNSNSNIQLVNKYFMDRTW